MGYLTATNQGYQGGCLVDFMTSLFDSSGFVPRRICGDWSTGLILPDGSIHVLNDRGSVILNEEGEPIRLVGTAQDVTELRQTDRHGKSTYA